MTNIEFYLPYFSLLLIGLIGSAHCIGMCGGLQQLFINMSPKKNNKTLLTYHLGRLTSYALITLLIATLLANFSAQTKGLMPYSFIIRLLSNAIIIWIGLNYFIRIRLPKWLNVTGSVLWKNIQTLVRPFLPPRNQLHVFIIGLAWGWLPCSLVYSSLAISLSVDGVVKSVIAMLCFGIGTMPLLMGIGSVNQYLQKNSKYEKLLASVLILIGSYSFISVFV